jgi:hypothetical protein
VVEYPVQHPAAASVQGADLSVQASWWVRRQAEAWSADRCAAVERLREAHHAPSARAHLRAACQRAVSLAEQQSAVRAVWDARVRQVAAPEEAAARESAQQPAGAAVLLVPRAVVAAEHAAGVAAVAQHEAAGAAAGPAFAPAAAVGEAAGVPVSRQAAAEPRAVQELQAAVRLLAAPWAFHPGRVLPWPAPRRAVRSARAMQRSGIASP